MIFWESAIFGALHILKCDHERLLQLQPCCTFGFISWDSYTSDVLIMNSEKRDRYHINDCSSCISIPGCLYLVSVYLYPDANSKVYRTMAQPSANKREKKKSLQVEGYRIKTSHYPSGKENRNTKHREQIIKITVVLRHSIWIDYHATCLAPVVLFAATARV